MAFALISISIAVITVILKPGKETTIMVLLGLFGGAIATVVFFCLCDAIETRQETDRRLQAPSSQAGNEIRIKIDNSATANGPK